MNIIGSIAKIAVYMVFVVAVAFVLGALFAFPVKWLWNWLMPTLFGLKVISAWQAWGLMVLSGFPVRVFVRVVVEELRESRRRDDGDIF